MSVESTSARVSSSSSSSTSPAHASAFVSAHTQSPHTLPPHSQTHAFVPALHHPVIEVVQHITSPLTAALVIFAVHKRWQFKAMTGWLNAKRILAFTNIKPPSGLKVPSVVPPTVPSSTVASISSATKHSHPPSRQFHSISIARSSSLSAQPTLSPASASQRLGSIGLGTTATVAFLSSTLPLSRARSIHWRNASSLSRSSVPPLSRRGPTFSSSRPILLHSVRSMSFLSRARQSISSFISSNTFNRPLLKSSVPVAAAAAVSSKSAPPSTASQSIVNAATDMSSNPIESEIPHVPLSAARQLLETVGDAITNFWPVVQMDNLIHSFVDSGMPYWQAIAFVTVLMRFVALPFNISLLANSSRLKMILPEAERLGQQLKAAKTEEEKVAAASELVQLYKTHNCHPLRNVIIPLGFPPLFLSLFAAVRNMTMYNPALATGGALWFTDLMAPDPTFLMPVLSALSWLWCVELGAGAYYWAWPEVRNTVRFVALAFIPVTATLPAGVFIFWLTANLFAITRTYLMRTDRARTLFNIPRVRQLQSLPHVPKPEAL